MTDVSLDLEVFEMIDLDETVPCSAEEECPNEATGFVVCRCEQRETVCSFHGKMVVFLQTVTPDTVIHFSATCGHHMFVKYCKIVPLK